MGQVEGKVAIVTGGASGIGAACATTLAGEGAKGRRREALRRFVDFDPQPLTPQTQALKAILERLEPQKPQPIPDTASTG